MNKWSTHIATYCTPYIFRHLIYYGLFYILTKKISIGCVNIIYIFVYIYDNIVDMDTPIREQIHECWKISSIMCNKSANLGVLLFYNLSAFQLTLIVLLEEGSVGPKYVVQWIILVCLKLILLCVLCLFFNW
jgi:hypothetical protein